MSKKEKDQPSLHAKRDSSGSGDRRRSAASGDGETGGERRVSRGSRGSAEHIAPSLGTGGLKKVLFSEQVTVKDPVKRLSQTGPLLEHQTSQGEEDSPKSQKKAVSTWRMACGMTKDKTKDLLKRWRTLPDQGPERPPLQELKANTGDHGWSVHVWGVDSMEESESSIIATWVKRCPSDEEPCDLDKERGMSWTLTDTQKEKLSYFFAHVFDMDRDDVISLQDFEGFSEVDRCVRAPFDLKSQNELFSDHRDFKETLDDLLNVNDCPEVEGSETSSDRFREWLLENPEATGVGRILTKEEKGYASFIVVWDGGKFAGYILLCQASAFSATLYLSSGLKKLEKICEKLATLLRYRERETKTEHIQRLRHFAEWSSNSGEYLILQQVQQGLIETFIYPLKQEGESSEGTIVHLSTQLRAMDEDNDIYFIEDGEKRKLTKTELFHLITAPIDSDDDEDVDENVLCEPPDEPLEVPDDLLGANEDKKVYVGLTPDGNDLLEANGDELVCLFPNENDVFEGVIVDLPQCPAPTPSVSGVTQHKNKETSGKRRKKRGIETEERTPKDLDRLFLSIDDWLNFWGKILVNKKSFYDLPLWLQYFPKVVFTAINKSGSGCISKEELGVFYSSVLSYPPQKLNDLLNEAYNAMTAGGDFKLTYDCYRLCFANFLFGRYPNGPGQFVFGAAQKSPPALFPIDYTAMNTPPEDIEPYNGSLRSNRSSVIV